jgi:hypothetical protein
VVALVAWLPYVLDVTGTARNTVRITRPARRSGPVLLAAGLVAAGVAGAGAQAMASAPALHVARAASAAPPGPHSFLRGLTAPFQPDAIVGDSVLLAVFCTSGINCWAVGNYEFNNIERNQALRFNGKKWSRVATPSPGGTAVGDSSVLTGVWCTSPANCWAVGGYDKDDASLSQALHWNGRKWSLAATPDPGGTVKGDFNDLSGVVCTSPVNCWAGGDYGGEVDDNELSFNLVLHWNGQKWSHASTPDPAGSQAGDINDLEAIRCTSAANCWGVGGYGTLVSDASKLFNEVLRWNGRKWLTVTVPSPGKLDEGNTESGLNALSCPSAKNCWAIGTDTGTNRLRNEVLHWNGSHWLTVFTRNLASGADAVNVLAGVSCTSGSNCWAAGDSESGSSGSPDLNEMLHWSGRQWSLVTVPEPAGTGPGSDNALGAVRCVSAADCWAVGETEKSAEPEVNQILRWNGKKWLVAG